MDFCRGYSTSWYNIARHGIWVCLELGCPQVILWRDYQPLSHVKIKTLRPYPYFLSKTQDLLKSKAPHHTSRLRLLLQGSDRSTISTPRYTLRPLPTFGKAPCRRLRQLGRGVFLSGKMWSIWLRQFLMFLCRWSVKGVVIGQDSCFPVFCVDLPSFLLHCNTLSWQWGVNRPQQVCNLQKFKHVIRQHQTICQ